ncbi:hypothetical protein ABH15_07170 [Methanoculleus taiwanensis]|uniref:ABC transporter n=1 Tax=Methanoculleus taiwanensis TaxID=1550565 RepID=A0A498H0X4_9EURY|nr:metal ABC transporter permease [Methanoculleus taiwanensis]RXE55975.1 hypothetical protein ABH15_07170 [Methanoculleus taiwanensis]
MLEVLEFAFFQNALLAGMLASIACGIIGTYVVVKRMVFIAGGISHASFGGIGLGYYFGIDPILGAFGFTLAAALGMGAVRLSAKQRMDTLIGTVWAAGMAVGILFVYLTPGFAPDLFSYLFGNILLVPAGDLWLMGGLVVVTVGLVMLFYNEFLAVTFDEEYATIMNLPVRAFYLLLLALVACTVVMLIRVVGIILVIALLTLPPATSAEFTARLRPMMLLSVVLGILYTTGGIWLSYLLDVPSGATIILIGTAGYAGAVAVRVWNGR